MQEWIALFILAVVQGITEWLPISSSGHLILFERLLAYNASLEFEIALHFGTLMAVFVYFGKDIVDMIQDVLKGDWQSEHGATAWLLVVATIPAGLVGYFFYDFFSATFENLTITAIGFALTGIFLLLASLDLSRAHERVRLSHALFMGLAQMLAILPGISRAGSTMAAGIIGGLSEKSALRFSFLMAIPIIFGASFVSFGTSSLSPSFLWASLVSFGIGLASIHVLLRYVLTTKRNLRWFGAYALVLAVVLLSWLFLF